MNTSTLYIKNMVCNRCIKVVKADLEAAGLQVLSTKLGEAVVSQSPEEIDYTKVSALLEEDGFELLDDRKSRLIEKVKTIVIELIHQPEYIELQHNFSSYIEEKSGADYNYLSSLFSTTEGVTIEKYIILQRIERAKELMIYDELNLSEISYKLGYSSLQHFSNQFKKTTGHTPSEFKKLQSKPRKPLDSIR